MNYGGSYQHQLEFWGEFLPDYREPSRYVDLSSCGAQIQRRRRRRVRCYRHMERGVQWLNGILVSQHGFVDSWCYYSRTS